MDERGSAPAGDAAQLREVWDSNWKALDVDAALRDVLKGDDASPNTLAYRPAIDRVLAHYDAPVVLESGCGMGQWLYYVAKKTNGTAIGLDLAASTLGRIAAAPLMQPYLQDGRVRLLEGDMRRTPLPSGSVDVIFSFGVIEHVVSEDSQKAVNEFARLLRPGGRTLITTPNPFSMHTITRPILKLARKWTVGFERSIAPRGLRSYAMKAGLVVESYGVLDSGYLFGAVLADRITQMKRLGHAIERRQRLFGFLSYCVGRKDG